MHPATYPPPVPFVVTRKHALSAAHGWLSARFDRFDWAPSVADWWGRDCVRPPLIEDSRSLKPDEQLALLKACLERMLWHRAQSIACQDNSIDYYLGACSYQLACHLYQLKLPCTEQDHCDILELSQHDCGHGSDVSPPFDNALAWARQHGLSEKLLASFKLFRSRLKGVNSSQAQRLKRKSELLALLDEETKKSRTMRCWSEQFRAALRAVPDNERTLWRDLIVQMGVNDGACMTKNFKAAFPKLIDELGVDRFLEFLVGCWPNRQERETWPLQTGGSYLLQHFVWMFGMLSLTKKQTRICDTLVKRLCELDWKPRERAQKVMVAAARYLADRPPSVAWTAIQNLVRWTGQFGPVKKTGYRSDKITTIHNSYAKEHGLS